MRDVKRCRDCPICRGKSSRLKVVNLRHLTLKVHRLRTVRNEAKLDRVS